MSASDRSATFTNQKILKKETNAWKNNTTKANSRIPFIDVGKIPLPGSPFAVPINAPIKEGNASPTKLDKNKNPNAAINLPRYGLM